MDLEWVKQWKPARVTHYKSIENALDLTKSLESTLEKA
jgi:hypothetical protein